MLVPALFAFAVALLVRFLAWSGWFYPLKPELLRYLSILLTPLAELAELEAPEAGPPG